MYRHVVMFQLAADRPEGTVTAIQAGLNELPRKIPQIAAYVHGPNVGSAPTNFDYVLVADFESAADFATYRDHPDHQQFIAEYITPFVTERHAVQYEC